MVEHPSIRDENDDDEEDDEDTLHQAVGMVGSEQEFPNTARGGEQDPSNLRLGQESPMDPKEESA